MDINQIHLTKLRINQSLTDQCPACSLQLLTDHLYCPILLEHIFVQNGPCHGWRVIIPLQTVPLGEELVVSKVCSY